MRPTDEIRAMLLESLTEDQRNAVTSRNRRVLVVAGAGSGKTEVMARRIAWWVGIEGISKDNIVAFTFTKKAAKEMKFRIRSWIERISDEGETVTMGGMYIGTIHGFSLQKLRELWPDDYHNYEVIDEGGRAALLQRGFHSILGLDRYRVESGVGHFEASEQFLKAYDILQEYNLFDVNLPAGDPPIELGEPEREYCLQVELNTNVGDSPQAQAFSVSAARYYGYLKCRRFLDFSTSQREFLSQFLQEPDVLSSIRESISHLVVDEVQDINPVQDQIINSIVGDQGHLTAVGDHRQAIFAWRGGRVDIIARMWMEIGNSDDSEVVELRENFRSTNRIIELANIWAQTIREVGGMITPDMIHGNINRVDYYTSHTSIIRLKERQNEADWF
jgi:DNA helicase-2/ATP-dependent DNA helicase PcrA